jgi:dihydroneopterin aldolase
MSDEIRLTGIYGYGYHGVLDHERENGQDFYVDLTLLLDLSIASRSDNLEDTIDYSAASDLVVSAIQGPPYSLLEGLGGHIADQLLAVFPLLEKVQVTVHKPQAPITAKLEDIAVTVQRNR